MSPVMTSASQKRHIIHDSGGCFDPRFSHTNTENRPDNDSITGGNMPFTNSDEESSFMTECDDNTTVRDRNIETSSSFTSEVDFESLVSEMAHNNGEDSKDNKNEYPHFSPETTDMSSDDQTGRVVDLAESLVCYRCDENVLHNGGIGGKCFENGLSGHHKDPSKTNPAVERILQQTIVSIDHINNNDRFPKGQNIFEYGRSSTENRKTKNYRNADSLYKSMGNQGRDADAIHIHSDVENTYDDVIHHHNSTTDCSNGNKELKSYETNYRFEKSNNMNGWKDIHNGCGNATTDQILPMSIALETRSDENCSTSVSFNKGQCLADTEIDQSAITESRMKAIFISNWTQGLPQTGNNNSLQLLENGDEVSDSFISQTNRDRLFSCTDDSTFVGSDSCTSVSLDMSETTCPFSSVGEMPQLLRKDSCCSISSLSTLSIPDFLLGTSSKSSSPCASLLHSRRTSIDDTADKELCQSKKSSSSNTQSKRSSVVFEGHANLTRKLSGISRSPSPILEDTHLEQFGEESPKPSFAKVTIIYPESQSSRKSSMSMSVDSSPSTPSRKSSNADRRISNGSDISSISLSGIFTDRGSLLSRSPDPMEDTDRTDTPSPSPFGHQLKYFQDKRKNEMFLLKTTTARLGLNTRRKSYSLWREENLDTKGRPVLMKPTINIGQKSDVFTKERVTAINMAMDWVREELHQLREQDESLAHQFLEIRRTIHELKLDWSCESHREMLMDAEEEIDEINTLKRVSDLPEHHSLDGVFRDKRMTRRSLGNRKYSIF